MSRLGYIRTILIVLLVTVVPLLTGCGGSGGSGNSGSGSSEVESEVTVSNTVNTSQPTYIITNINELQAMNNNLLANYVLGNDIDASDTRNWNNGEGFIPIGSQSNPFLGTFNGSGYEISGLYINQDIKEYSRGGAGLFDQVGYIDIHPDKPANYFRPWIENVSLVNAEMIATAYIGGLAAAFFDGTINNCSVSGTITATGDYQIIQYIGGMVGRFNDGTISNSSSSAEVNGIGNYIGGLVGDLVDATISNSYSTGNVMNEFKTPHTSTMESGEVLTFEFGQYVGGLVGRSIDGTISNSYSTGNVTGSNRYTGGLVGKLAGGTVSNSFSTGNAAGVYYTGGLTGYFNAIGISNSYSTGNVTGLENFGGLIGSICCLASEEICSSKITNSYWDINTSGQFTTARNYGEGRTTAEMKELATYAGWDFSTVWNITEGIVYPYLR